MYPPPNEELDQYNHPAYGDLLRGFGIIDSNLEHSSLL
jgi:hypothetical protein